MLSAKQVELVVRLPKQQSVNSCRCINTIFSVFLLKKSFQDSLVRSSKMFFHPQAARSAISSVAQTVIPHSSLCWGSHQASSPDPTFHRAATGVSTSQRMFWYLAQWPRRPRCPWPNISSRPIHVGAEVSSHCGYYSVVLYCSEGESEAYREQAVAGFKLEPNAVLTKMGSRAITLVEQQDQLQLWLLHSSAPEQLHNWAKG